MLEGGTVSGNVGVSLNSSATKTTLSENVLGEGTAKPNNSSFTLALSQAPANDVKVYLTDANDQLDLSATVLTFTSANYASAQSVTISATADSKNEGASQAAPLSFQVVSQDSSYDGFLVSPLNFLVVDNVAPLLATPTGLAYTDTESDGYQRHAASDGKGAMANLGWQITPTLETRFFVRYRETNHETPGRLTRDQIRNDPRAANPANLAIDARRPQPGSTWIGNMTTWQIDEASSLQAGLVYHKYPMDLNESLYRQQLDYSNLNATVDYRHRHLQLGRTSVTTLGLRVTHDLDADVRETLRFEAIA